MDGIRPVLMPGSPAAERAAGKDAVQSPEECERERQLKKACRDFEANFAYCLLKNMRRTVPAGGLTGHATGKDTYEMLMDQKIAEEAAGKGGGLGLQKILFDQLNRRPQK